MYIRFHTWKQVVNRFTPVQWRRWRVRVAVRDLEAAQELAERKSLPYQTHIKMLLHEALERERRSA